MTLTHKQGVEQIFFKIRKIMTKIKIFGSNLRQFLKNFIFNNLLFNLYCASKKIFPDLGENLPLGVVFCVDHESDIIFRAGTGIKANRAIEITLKLALFLELSSHISAHMEASETGSKQFL